MATVFVHFHRNTFRFLYKHKIVELVALVRPHDIFEAIDEAGHSFGNNLLTQSSLA